jgi:hypothetical protein
MYLMFGDEAGRATCLLTYKKFCEKGEDVLGPVVI